MKYELGRERDKSLNDIKIALENDIKNLRKQKDQEIDDKDQELQKVTSNLKSKANECDSINSILANEKEMYTSTINTLKLNVSNMESEVQRTIQRGKDLETDLHSREEALKKAKQELDHTFELKVTEMDQKFKEDARKLLDNQRDELMEIRKNFDQTLKDLRKENELVR